MSIESTLGEGTTVRITLPMGRGSVAPRPAPRALPDSPGRRLSILVVDDDELVRRSIARALRHHDVMVFADAESAAVRLTGSERPDVVLCDLMMPGVSGVDLHERLALEAPDLLSRLVFVTGGAVTERARAFIERGDIRWLAKPIDPRQLQAMLDEVTTVVH